jgi:large subunit ribosomal protein L25
MAHSVLNVRKRVRLGKSGSKEIRREGNVPAILYGKGSTPIPLLVDPKDLKQALSTEAGENTLIEMHISDGDEDITKLSLLRDVQVDYITDKSIHFDFLELDVNTLISVQVPVKIVGRSIGVYEQNGILDEVLREISVECLPANIPNAFEIDVTSLELGDSIHVKDLEISEEVEILDEPESTIVTIVAPKVEAEPELEAVEEEAVEAEEEAAGDEDTAEEKSESD